MGVQAGGKGVGIPEWSLVTQQQQHTGTTTGRTKQQQGGKGGGKAGKARQGAGGRQRVAKKGDKAKGKGAGKAGGGGKGANNNRHTTQAWSTTTLQVGSVWSGHCHTAQWVGGARGKGWGWGKVGRTHTHCTQ